MEATKIFTSGYLQNLIKNQLKNNLPLTCPEGCNPKQYNKQLQLIRKETIL